MEPGFEHILPSIKPPHSKLSCPGMATEKVAYHPAIAVVTVTCLTANHRERGSVCEHQDHSVAMQRWLALELTLLPCRLLSGCQFSHLVTSATGTHGLAWTSGLQFPAVSFPDFWLDSQ